MTDINKGLIPMKSLSQGSPHAPSPLWAGSLECVVGNLFLGGGLFFFETKFSISEALVAFAWNGFGYCFVGPEKRVRTTEHFEEHQFNDLAA